MRSKPGRVGAPAVRLPSRRPQRATASIASRFRALTSLPTPVTPKISVMAAESVDRAFGMRTSALATVVALVAGASVCAAPARGAGACDHDDVRVVVTVAKPGPNDRVDASGRL